MVQPHERRYAVYQVTLDGGGRENAQRIGTLTETLERVNQGGDSVFLQVRVRDLWDYGKEIDSLTINYHTLAPLTLRTHLEGRRSCVGINFTATGVSRFGTEFCEAVDTTLGPAFWEGTEPLILLAVFGTDRKFAPFSSSMMLYDESLGLFIRYDARVRTARSDGQPHGVENGSPDTLHVEFGRLVYWVTKDFRTVVRWEEPVTEADFYLRFVLE